MKKISIIRSINIFYHWHVKNWNIFILERSVQLFQFQGTLKSALNTVKSLFCYIYGISKYLKDYAELSEFLR